MNMIEREVERTKQEAGGMVAVLLVAAIVFGSLAMTGCAGAGFRTEIYRIDQRQESVSTINQPIKCLFTECGGK